MILKFNRDGLGAKLVLSSYKSNTLPSSICPFFWKLVFAIIALPFQWIFVWYTWKKELPKGRLGEKMPMIGGVFFGLLAQVVVALIIKGFYTNPYEALNNTLWLFGIIVAIIGVIAIVYLIVENWYDIKQFFIKNKDGEDRKVTVVAAYIEARKNKFCPAIDWETKDKKSEL
jgi:hypothetical protein|tara:strand:+ start:72 stop:587 length:516 start_codon:yes stop_codon:yes gene_type:complete